MTSTATPKVKLDNNALFAERLRTNPPEYEMGTKVVFTFVSNANGRESVGFITGRVFNERDNVWKYTVTPYGLKNFHVEAIVIGRHK